MSHSLFVSLRPRKSLFCLVTSTVKLQHSTHQVRQDQLYAFSASLVHLIKPLFPRCMKRLIDGTSDGKCHHQHQCSFLRHRVPNALLMTINLVLTSCINNISTSSSSSSVFKNLCWYGCKNVFCWFKNSSSFPSVLDLQAELIQD